MLSNFDAKAEVFSAVCPNGAIIYVSRGNIPNTILRKAKRTPEMKLYQAKFPKNGERHTRNGIIPKIKLARNGIPGNSDVCRINIKFPMLQHHVETSGGRTHHLMIKTRQRREFY